MQQASPYRPSAPAGPPHQPDDRRAGIGLIVLVFLAGVGAIARPRGRRRPTRRSRRTRPARRRQTMTDVVLPEESIIYDRTGKVELARFGDAKREVVTFDEIPPVLLDATTAVEDKTFWENAGFDPVAIISAGARLAARQQPRRLDDHPAAGPRPPAPVGPRPGPEPDRRAQAQGDHPVDPA